MDRVHDAIEWYQKKIGSYDKQLWEQSVEKKLQKQPSYILHNAPRRKVRLKTEFIDVDLIRGSTFTKTKPQVPWVYVTKKALARVIFFPFFYSWWIHQTSKWTYGLLLCLYVLQVASVCVYICADDGFLEDEMSFTEVILPMILMFLLCLIHSQTVLAHISHKPPKHKAISGVTRKPKPRPKKATRKGRNSGGNSTCAEDGGHNDAFKQSGARQNHGRHSPTPLVSVAEAVSPHSSLSTPGCDQRTRVTLSKGVREDDTEEEKLDPVSDPPVLGRCQGRDRPGLSGLSAAAAGLELAMPPPLRGTTSSSLLSSSDVPRAGKVKGRAKTFRDEGGSHNRGRGSGVSPVMMAGSEERMEERSESVCSNLSPENCHGTLTDNSSSGSFTMVELGGKEEGQQPHEACCSAGFEPVSSTWSGCSCSPALLGNLPPGMGNGGGREKGEELSGETMTDRASAGSFTTRGSTLGSCEEIMTQSEEVGFQNQCGAAASTCGADAITSFTAAGQDSKVVKVGGPLCNGNSHSSNSTSGDSGPVSLRIRNQNGTGSISCRRCESAPSHGYSLTILDGGSAVAGESHSDSEAVNNSDVCVGLAEAGKNPDALNKTAFKLHSDSEAPNNSDELLQKTFLCDSGHVSGSTCQSSSDGNPSLPGPSPVLAKGGACDEEHQSLKFDAGITDKQLQSNSSPDIPPSLSMSTPHKDCRISGILGNLEEVIATTHDTEVGTSSSTTITCAATKDVTSPNHKPLPQKTNGALDGPNGFCSDGTSSTTSIEPWVKSQMRDGDPASATNDTALTSQPPGRSSLDSETVQRFSHQLAQKILTRETFRTKACSPAAEIPSTCTNLCQQSADTVFTTPSPCYPGISASFLSSSQSLSSSASSSSSLSDRVNRPPALHSWSPIPTNGTSFHHIPPHSPSLGCDQTDGHAKLFSQQSQRGHRSKVRTAPCNLGRQSSQHSPQHVRDAMEESNISEDDDNNDGGEVADDADVDDDDGEDEGGVLSDLSSHKGSESDGETADPLSLAMGRTKQLRFLEAVPDGEEGSVEPHTCQSSPAGFESLLQKQRPSGSTGTGKTSLTTLTQPSGREGLGTGSGVGGGGSHLSVVGILSRKLAPFRDLGLARKSGGSKIVPGTSSASDQEDHISTTNPIITAGPAAAGAQQHQQPQLRRRRRVSGTPADSATPGQGSVGNQTGEGSGSNTRTVPSTLGLRASRDGNKHISSSENEAAGGHTPEGSNKAAVSSEEWEDRIQTDETTSSAYSSTCGDSGEEFGEGGARSGRSLDDDGEERTEYTTSTLHVINLLQPGGSPSNSGGNVTQSDRVSCLIWEGNECKKVDLTALDIGWAIIDKVDSLPESSDYFLIGLLFSCIIALVPLTFRAYVNKETLPWGEMTTMAGLLGKMLEMPTLLSAVYSWRQWLLLVNSILQRFFLSLTFFFLLSVADRTFKQRLLYAKHFSYLTSSRRARKFTMPHFRLSKVRNIKIWLSLRSYLKRRGPQRSVDVIVSACFMCAICTVSLISLQMLKDTDSYLDYLCNWELLVWCCGLAVFLMRFMTVGLNINKKYRNLSVLITEQINLYLQMEQKPHKKDELILANNVLRLAEDLLKELESPFKISGFSANPVVYNIMRVVVLSAFSAVISEVLGFKLKLHKIKLKG